jgi:hypothetical protein
MVRGVQARFAELAAPLTFFPIMICRTTSMCWWLGIAIAAAPAANAQGSATSEMLGGGQAINVSVGIAEAGRIDETASPLRYSGHGADFSVGWARTFAPFSVVASLEGGTRSLTPIDGADDSSEHLTEGALDVALLKSVNRSAAAGDFKAGIEFSASATVNEQSYPGADGFKADFLLAAASLGPAAAWAHALGGGELSANVGVPLFAFVDHPFSDIRGEHAPLTFRFTSIESYRGFHGGLSYTHAVTRTTGIVYAYRIGFLHFDDDQPVRAVTQSLSIGLVRRIGKVLP